METRDLVSEVSQCFYLWLPFSSVEDKVEEFLKENSEIDEFQAALVAQICESKVAAQFPVHPEKRLKFVKGLIRVLERHGVDVSDGLYNALNNSTARDVFYKSYFVDSVYVLSLSESVEMISHGTTGLKTWQAAELLTRFLRASPEIVKGLRVLELGSGVGFTGISLVKLGIVDRIVLSDCHGRVLEKLRHNCRVNFAESNLEQSPESMSVAYEGKEIKVLEIDWDTFSGRDLDNLNPDCVIAADVVYDPSIVPSLVRTIATCLNNGAKFALVACTPRNPETLDSFVASMGDHKFMVQKKEVSCSNPDGVIIYHITRQ